MSPLRLGLPEGRAVSPLRLGLPEDGAVFPVRLGVPEGRAVSPLRLGLPEAGLCLPSDWGSLKQAKLCNLQFESPTRQEFLVPPFYFKLNLPPSCMRLTPLPFLLVS